MRAALLAKKEVGNFGPTPGYGRFVRSVLRVDQMVDHFVTLHCVVRGVMDYAV